MVHPRFSRLLQALALWALVEPVAAADFTLRSPDDRIEFRLSRNAQGHLEYSVVEGQKVRFEPAGLGVQVDGRDLGLAEVRRFSEPRTIEETFPWRGNKTIGTNRCRSSEVLLSGGTGPEYALEVRVFDDGAGVRFKIPGTGERMVNGESTAWKLPGDATVWIQTDTDDYEGVYHSRRADQVPLEQEVDKKTRPTYIGLPMTIEFAGGGFGLITEAALYNYSGVTLRPEGQGRFGAAFEDDPRGWAHEGEIRTPWRVFILAKDLNGLVNSDVIAALCDPPDPVLFPDGPNAPWLKPGKAPCTWMVFGNDGAQWDRQKWFVDQAAATGCEYLLVDAGWRTEKWGWLKGGADVWDRAAQLCRYAGERNVGIVLWHAFPEGRDDGPGLTTVEAREELFRRCHEAGVKGIKIDFFNSESKATIDAYEDLLRRSAKYRLLINFHGANKPAGEARTWPNEITREGIREQEYVLWDSLPLAHYGALPFTRMAVGHADFLPGYVQPKFLKTTTTIFQMASVVVFSSPFLCWPENPEAYLDSPLLQFVRTVPVTWEETRVLPESRIGDTVIMARRKGNEWYVAALNCRSEARTIRIDIASLNLKGSELVRYTDNSEGHGCQIQTGLTVPPDGILSADCRAGGGFIGHFRPAKKYAGW